jgi:hypothetical protein
MHKGKTFRETAAHFACFAVLLNGSKAFHKKPYPVNVCGEESAFPPNVNETSKFDLIPRRSLRLHQCHSKKRLWCVREAASTVGTFAQVNGHLNIGEHLILKNMLPRINN